MAEEDNFDIDIYGDGATGDNGAEPNGNGENDYKSQDMGDAGNGYGNHNGTEQERPTDEPVVGSEETVEQSSAPSGNAPQGTKRKQMDDRIVDPNSTHAVQLTELHWWITEDDIRGWCVKAEAESEIRDITFNEHKVNGKSKGQVYIEFQSPQAATALKHFIDALEPKKSDPKVPQASYFHGQNNPYKTLPKDNARRSERAGGDRNFSGSGSNFSGNFNSGGNFRGGRGNFSGNRGGMNNGGFNRGGFQGGMNGNMNNNMGGTMGMGYGGMNQGFNNFNRGGMMNGMRGGMPPNRGGRGGMGGPTPGMMNPMAGMNMGGMPMGAMGMGGQMMGMPGGFQGQPHFNPTFFQGQASGGADWGNPHGTKRPRPNE